MRDCTDKLPNRDEDVREKPRRASGSPTPNRARLAIPGLDLTAFALAPYDESNDLEDGKEVERFFLARRRIGGDR